MIERLWAMRGRGSARAIAAIVPASMRREEFDQQLHQLRGLVRCFLSDGRELETWIPARTRAEAIRGLDNKHAELIACGWIDAPLEPETGDDVTLPR